ncbi:MAG TPA: extracellular solute-binding protein [Herbaspirillum sp.]|jgi:iron(III) transport system substrate-binding protein
MRNVHGRRAWLAAAAILGAAMASVLALGGCGRQDANGMTAVGKVASYQGADRAQFLLDGARKEGTLTIYTSGAATDIETLVDDFKKKYGLKVEVWRSGQNEVRSRIIQEARARKNTFDIVLTTGKAAEAVYREHLLQKVDSPYFKDLIAQALLPHREWTGDQIAVFVQEYNPQKLKKSELPKTYLDLLDPKWKNRLGIEASDYEWVMGVAKSMGEEQGVQFFKDLARNNRVSVWKGHTVLNNAVILGEVALGLTQYHYIPAQSKADGASLDWFALQPAIAQMGGLAMSRSAPHPYAATLFYDYMLTDGQKVFAALNFIPVNKNVDSPYKDIRYTVSDSAEVLDENDKWNDLYNKIFLKQK